MKTIFRLLCGWMAITLAACTGDELQQIEPLQKPVAQKTISVKAYTPSEQAATRLAFTEEDDGSLSLAWTADDAFTAVIGEGVTFTYDTENGEFTADVNENFELSNGTIAYYPAYDGENFEMDLSQQTGQLNGATTYMKGVYEGDAFKFTHSTAILMASFGLPQNATISSVGIDVVAGENSFQIAISQPANLLYINLPAIANGGKLTFDVRTSDGTLYTATKTVAAVKGIETGVYYNTTVELQEACLLPTGDEFKSAVKSFLNENSSLTKIKFVANSSNTNKDNQISNSRAYMVADSDNETLEIHTTAAQFVFNADCSSMFSYLTNIQSIDFGNCVNTANVVNMDDMFNSCYALTSLDLSNFNTANVEQMSYMFNFCSELTSLDLSSFNTANVIFMNDMFNSCSSLTSLDLSNFNTEKVTSMASMFSYCSNISELDLINFDFRNVDVGYGFDGMFTNLGEYSDNLPPVIIYVKDENDKIILKSANTGIPDRVIISVKQS